MACRLIGAKPLTNGNSYIFIQDNTFENVVCKIVPFCLGLNILTYVIFVATRFVLSWLYHHFYVESRGLFTHIRHGLFTGTGSIVWPQDWIDISKVIMTDIG